MILWTSRPKVFLHLPRRRGHEHGKTRLRRGGVRWFPSGHSLLRRDQISAKLLSSPSPFTNEA